MAVEEEEEEEEEEVGASTPAALTGCPVGTMGPDPAGPDGNLLFSPAAWQRSVKRKLYGMGENDEGGKGDGGRGSPPPLLVVAARVGAADEAEALREALAAQEAAAAGLCDELEEERAASASAASEAMSMILRLQREKGEAQMEACQFKRLVEERMAQDQRELLVLGDLLYEREQQIQALSWELETYHRRLLSHGIAAPDPIEPAADTDAATLESCGSDDGEYDRAIRCEYPHWRCSDDPDGVDTGIDDGEDDAYLEMEKEVVMGQSPRRQLSRDSFGSLQQEELHSLYRRGDDDDATSDRIYTVDAVHCGAELISDPECYVGTATEVCKVDGPSGEEETDMKKLEMRIQALEADRESMRHAILSVQSDRAQLVLLKDISQHLCRGASPPCSPLERKVVKKPCFLWWFSFLSIVKLFLETSFVGGVSFMSTIKWIMSFVLWKKKTDRSKYMFGLSNNNVGLLLLLDNAPRIRQLRCLSRTRD